MVVVRGIKRAMTIAEERKAMKHAAPQKMIGQGKYVYQRAETPTTPAGSLSNTNEKREEGEISARKEASKE